MARRACGTLTQPTRTASMRNEAGPRKRPIHPPGGPRRTLSPPTGTYRDQPQAPAWARSCACQHHLSWSIGRPARSCM
jgi:hypothetical protein